MSKRTFSTAAANWAKSITWVFRGTTQDLGGHLKVIENAVANVPGLQDKVDKGEIM